MDLVTSKPLFGLASDLHLDFADINPEFFEWRGDYLLLAGDIAEDDHLRKMEPFWDKVSRMAKQVFVISGNHEYYGSELDVADRHIDEFLSQWPNIKTLRNEAVDLGNVILFGGTMWTDYGGNNPLSIMDASSLMNDYKQIRVKHKAYSKLRPTDILLEHGFARNALQNALEQYPDRPFLVMTHHGPTMESIHPHYRGGQYNTLNDAYCNRFDRLIEETPQIQAWVHGHIHWLLNYDVCGCRVLCNPRGYPGERPDNLPPYMPLPFRLEY